MEVELSVVITTYNRRELLQLVLADLGKQSALLSRFEVLVIDNAGQEECRKLVESHNYKYFHETRIGHCHARNRGLKEAISRWVLYFDDDVRLPTTILDRVMGLLPNVDGAAFGGAFLHWYLSPPPDWLKIELGVGRFPGSIDAFGVLPEEEYLIGCFFAVDKYKTLDAGAFDPELGMKGLEVGWADETELQLRFRNLGHEIFYAPELIIEHLVQPWKCSFKGQLRHAYSLGKNNWIPHGSANPGWGSFFLEIFRITFVVFPVTIARWVFRHPEWYWQNVLLKVLPKYAYVVGRFTHRWEVTIS